LFFSLLKRRGGFDEEDLMALLLADIVEADHGTREERNGRGRSYAIEPVNGSRFRG
jgi:hypothetical protein